MKKKKRQAALFLAAVICVFQPLDAMAYFERGPVNVFLGESELVMEAGETRTVSVHFDPSESSQLPGCGMAECPQICGEKECLDENGECMCNGTDYHTYYAFAEASSSNTGVAAAEYRDGGILIINAVSPGTAVITATASLRQFTSTSAQMMVTVTEPPAAQDPPPAAPSGGSGAVPSGQGGNSGGSGNNNSVEGSNYGEVNGYEGNGIEVDQVTQPEPGQRTAASGTEAPSVSSASVGSASENKKKSAVSSNKSEKKTSGAKSKKKKSKQEEDQNYTIQSDRGEIMFIPLKPGKMGKEELEKILGKEIYADFQVMDEAENILYTWEFYGMGLKRAEDLDMTIDIRAVQPRENQYGIDSDSLYLAFTHDGALPGKASVYVRVSEHFSDGDVLNFYLDDEEKGLQLAEEGLTVENGYVSLSMSHCSNYILSAEKLEVFQDAGAEDNGYRVWVVVVVILAAAAAAVTAVFVIHNKNKRGEIS